MNHSRIFIFILLCSFILAGSLSAQGLTMKGIKGGVSLANFSGSDAEMFDIEPSMVTKFAVGAFLNIEINKQFSIRPEAYYSSKGAKYEEGDAELTVTLNYIDVPVLLVVMVADNFGIFVGPQLGFYMNGTMKSGSEEEDIESDEINSPAFDLVFGANFFINQFHIDARYAMGLTDVPDVDETVNLKNSVIQILFGVSF